MSDFSTLWWHCEVTHCGWLLFSRWELPAPVLDISSGEAPFSAALITLCSDSDKFYSATAPPPLAWTLPASRSPISPCASAHWSLISYSKGDVIAPPAPPPLLVGWLRLSSIINQCSSLYRPSITPSDIIDSLLPKPRLQPQPSAHSGLQDGALIPPQIHYWGLCIDNSFIAL